MTERGIIGSFPDSSNCAIYLTNADGTYIGQLKQQASVDNVAVAGIRGVYVVFNKSEEQISITDLEQHKDGLPIDYVSAKDYNTIRIRNKNGKLVRNRVLVINNVFSGGRVDRQLNKPVRDEGDLEQIPIPNGVYDILDNKASSDPEEKKWFRLDQRDSKPYNDKIDDGKGIGRDGFRFHLGVLSHGCVTVNATQEDAQLIWELVLSILNSTYTSNVKDIRKRQRYIPWSRLTKYGTLEVIGEDKIQIKKR